MAMSSESIRFNDGAGYDRFVGCGHGAFTRLIAEQSGPLTLVGIDPSEAQLAYARQQPMLQSVDLVNADAMALPFPSLHDRPAGALCPARDHVPLAGSSASCCRASSRSASTTWAPRVSSATVPGTVEAGGNGAAPSGTSS